MLAEPVARRIYRHIYGHPYHIAFRRMIRGKTLHFTAITLTIAVFLAPAATLWRYFVMLLLTYNGHAWINLLGYWLRIGYSQPYTLLRTHVLRKHFDQSGLLAWCQGSISDELAYEALNNGSFAEVIDAGDQADDDEEVTELLSPIAAQTEAHIIASVFEEIDYRILPWLLCGETLLGRGTFVCLSAIAFAGWHNISALTRKHDRWSLLAHIVVFYFTFIMGVAAALAMAFFPFWKAALLVILWHDNRHPRYRAVW